MAGVIPDSWLGDAEIEPTVSAIAGEHGSWTINFTVGDAGIDDGGRIRLAFYSSSDWAAPQFDDPEAPDYVSVHSSRSVDLSFEFGQHGVRPWARTLTIVVGGAALYPGDRVTIVLGDRSGGSPGMRAQTYPQNPYRISMQVDPIRLGIYREVCKLEIPLIGGAATWLTVVAPSDVIAEEPAWVHVRALDKWGNPDPGYRGTVRFTGDLPDGLPDGYRFTRDDAGVRRFEDIRFKKSDRVLRVGVHDAFLNVTAESNPIRCHSRAPERLLFWGDLHGQTHETGGAGTIEEYFAYGRDVAAIDACAHSGNDLAISNELYAHLCQQVDEFYEPGRYVTFKGYEWSGNTPGGGDRNVYYLNEGPIRRSSHGLVEDTSDIDTDRFPVSRFHEEINGREDVILTPHIGGRPATLDFHEPSVEPAIEIASQWGRFEWFANDALERGMRVAFIGGSDDHSGRPGWSWATLAHHGTRGGLTAYQATELTREGIWEALQSKRCYGTSGPRIILDVTVNGYPMGSEPVLKESPTLQARVIGTAPIDTIEVRRGTKNVYLYDANPIPDSDEPWRVRIAWRGARNYGRTRPLDWSGIARVINGRITAVEDYAIDNAIEGVQDWSAEEVSWISHTSGDWDGVILDIDGDEATRIDVRNDSLNLDFALRDLDAGPVTETGDLVEQKIVAKCVSRRAGPREITLEWTDDSPLHGWNPYWIWVTQSDGELAWSTPVYVQWSN